MSREDAKQHIDVIAGLYTESLMEWGVDLYHDEPTPIYDDYLRWHLSDEPTHLASGSIEWRTQMAYEAWLAACINREMRIASAAAARCTVYFLATKKAMMEVVLEHNGSIPTELGLTVRRRIVQSLWLQRLWCEPWCLLVDQEFPGPEPTAKDLEELEAFNETADDMDRAWRAEVDEVRAILFEHGYLAESQEDDLVFQLVTTAALLTIISCNRADEDIRDRRSELEVLVVEHSPNPDHPVWSAVIDHLITAKTSAKAIFGIANIPRK